MTKTPNLLWSALKAIPFLWLMLAHIASLNAHPPEFHSNGAKSGQKPTLVAKKDVADEADRQIAYFQFEFLSVFALDCPTEIQPLVIQQALAELHVATQTPQALPLQELLANRASLHARLIISIDMPALLH